jgi:dTDP-4-dehydrorhamnose reductase
VDLHNKRILVTGASGLLGVNLALEAAENHTVFGLVNRQPLQTDRFQVIQEDLLRPGAIEKVLDLTQPDWVIHCAALAIVDACEADPEKVRKVNTEIPTRLAEHVSKSGARLLHISTDAVFDGETGNYREEDSPNPLSVYARTKLEAEKAVRDVNPNALIARVNFVGWSVNGNRSLSEFFFNNLQIGKSVMGFTDVFFCPLLANDLAHLLLKMLVKKMSGLYHVVSRENISKYEFALRLAERFKLRKELIIPTPVAESGLKAARSPYLTLNTDRLRTDLGEDLPDIQSCLDGLHDLYTQGYRELLTQMGKRNPI